LKTNNQQRGMCKSNVSMEDQSIGIIRLWDCKNFVRGWLTAYATSPGINQTMYLPDSRETTGSCPRRVRSFPMNTHAHHQELEPLHLGAGAGTCKNRIKVRKLKKLIVQIIRNI
jgi:hypothetical protein